MLFNRINFKNFQKFYFNRVNFSNPIHKLESMKVNEQRERQSYKIKKKKVKHTNERNRAQVSNNSNLEFVASRTALLTGYLVRISK